MAEMTLVEGLGVEGDAHGGTTLRHRSRAAANPPQPNLRQLHLVQRELFTMVGTAGFVVGRAS
jgi:hypothetical protein